MNKSIILIILLLISSIPLSTANITSTSDVETIHLIESAKDYELFGFKDLGIYYTPESLVSFDMPFIVKLKGNSKVSSQDLSSRTSIVSKTAKYKYEVLAENKDYQVINYHMDKKAEIGFSMDFIPMINDVEFKEFAWWSSSWYYKKQIIIDSSQVPSNQVDFPVLINLSDADIQAYAQADGDDIVFVDSTETAQYNHEIDTYVNSVRDCAWVSIDALNSVSDTILYVYYGNAGASNQEHVSDVWDSDYVGVWHLGEVGSNFVDSTSYENTGVDYVSDTDKTGKIGAGQGFDGSDYIDMGDPADGSLDFASDGAFTLEGWAKTYAAWEGTLYEPLMVKGYYSSSSDCKYYTLFIRYPSVPSFIVRHDANIVIVNGGSGLSASTWYYFAGTYNNGDIELFVDSISQGTDTGGDNQLTTDNFYLGRWRTQYTSTTLDECRVSKCKRSADWLTISYNTINNVSLNCANPFISLGNYSGNDPPVVSNPNPANNSIDNALSFSWCVNITDDWTNFNWTIECENGQSNSANNDTNGTKCVSLSGLVCGTEYTIWVNATDNNQTVGEIYYFNTFACTGGVSYFNVTFSNEYPLNNSVDVCPCCDAICFDVVNKNVTTFNLSVNYTFDNITFYNWIDFRNVTNGTYCFCMCDVLFNKTYYWNVNCSNTTHYNLSNTFSFTTALNKDFCSYIKEGDMMNIEIGFGLGVFMFIVWILLLYLWHKSESEGMTTLLTMIFIPYDITFVLIGLPLFNASIWALQIIFIGIALIIGGYTIDMLNKEKK